MKRNPFSIKYCLFMPGYAIGVVRALIYMPGGDPGGAGR
jgi:hypothetical protein